MQNKIDILLTFLCVNRNIWPSKSNILLKNHAFAAILDRYTNMERKLLNRLKVVLAEKNKSNKWLSEQLDKDPAIISKWVTNTTQPNVETLIQISKVLGVTVDDLLRTE